MKSQSDVVCRPDSIYTTQLRFQNGADFVQILLTIQARKSIKKTLCESFQPPDDVAGKRCGTRNQRDAVNAESNPLQA
jgi:hypothetical protein